MANPKWADFNDADVRRAFEADPDNFFIPLDYLIARFDLSLNEAMGELRSGRLKTETSGDTMSRVATRSNGVSASEFHVPISWLIEWLENPKTPHRLKKKAALAIRQQRH